MEVFIQILMLVGGIVLVIFGGDMFVKSSIDIAKKTKIPEVIIGATLVSLATTLPELVVSVLSSAKGAYGLSVGNAVGTIICNTGLICGICLTAVKQRYPKKGTYMTFYVLLFSLLILMIYGINKNISLMEGITLVLIAIFFLFVNIFETKNHKSTLPTEQDASDFVEQEKEETLMPTWKMLLFFIFGAVGIGGGAYLMVEGGASIARMVGISEAFIGLTIMGIGTSIPELITTITAIRKKAPTLGVGNIVGANIINASLVVGLSGIVSGKSGLPISIQTLAISFPVAIVLNLLLVLPILVKKRTYRWQGVVLLSTYAIYVTTLIIMTIFGYVA